MALLIQFRVRGEPTDPAIVRAMRLVMQQGSASTTATLRTTAEQPLDDAAAEQASRNLLEDHRRAAQVVQRSAAQERAGGSAATTSIGRATATVPRVFQLDGERVEGEEAARARVRRRDRDLTGLGSVRLSHPPVPWAGGRL